MNNTKVIKLQKKTSWADYILPTLLYMVGFSLLYRACAHFTYVDFFYLGFGFFLISISTLLVLDFLDNQWVIFSQEEIVVKRLFGIKRYEIDNDFRYRIYKTKKTEALFLQMYSGRIKLLPQYDNYNELKLLLQQNYSKDISLRGQSNLSDYGAQVFLLLMSISCISGFDYLQNKDIENNNGEKKI